MRMLGIKQKKTYIQEKAVKHVVCKAHIQKKKEVFLPTVRFFFPIYLYIIIMLQFKF